MRDGKVNRIILISTIILVLFICLTTLLVYSDIDPIVWILEKIVSLRLYRYSIVVNFQNPCDVDCINNIFTAMDQRVIDQKIQENKIEYGLASKVILPKGWLDTFSEDHSLELIDSSGHSLNYISNVQSMSFDFDALRIILTDEYVAGKDEKDMESLSVFANGQLVDCEISYWSHYNELELIAGNETKDDTIMILIQAIVSFYSYPTCSNITVEGY